MKWKEIYDKCNHDENNQVTNIFRKFKISSNFKNYIKNYGIATLVILLVIVVFLAFTFRNNIIIVFYSVGLLILLFLLAMFYARYKIELTETQLLVKANSQETDVKYDKLLNIYMCKEKKRIFFIPIYYYMIKITYILDEESIGILSLPTIMLNKNQVINFFKSFDTKNKGINKPENKKKRK